MTINMLYRSLSACLALGLACPLFGQVTETVTIQYTFEEIPLGFGPIAMNNRGWIVGVSSDGLYPMRYRPGIGTETISGLPGVLYDINDKGIAVGYLYRGGFWQAIVRPAGQPWKIITNTLGGVPSAANAINEAGQVVGWALNTEGEHRPFVYSEATGMRVVIDIYGEASGINEVGQITGFYGGPCGYCSFLWDPIAGLTEIDGGFDAVGISDSGIVAGLFNGGFATFSLAEGLRKIGKLGGRASWPKGVNDRGWIVGFAEAESGGSNTALLYVRGRGLMDLNTLTPGLPDPLEEAVDINDRDQILAWGGGDPQKLFLLTRVH